MQGLPMAEGPATMTSDMAPHPHHAHTLISQMATHDVHAPLQVLNRLSIAIAILSFFGVLVIFLVLLVGRGASAGYAIVTAFVIFVASVPVGMPVVTTTVLAVGARQMAKEKAIVARCPTLRMLCMLCMLDNALPRVHTCAFEIVSAFCSNQMASDWL